MQIQRSARVEASLERVWNVLQDVPLVVTCIPRLDITETLDAEHWKAKVAIKVGPLAVGYDATIRRTALDPLEHSVTVQIEAVDGKDRSTVSATVVASAKRDGEQTEIDVSADAEISGMLARMVQGIIRDVAAGLLAKIAANIGKAANAAA